MQGTFHRVHTICTIISLSKNTAPLKNLFYGSMRSLTIQILVAQLKSRSPPTFYSRLTTHFAITGHKIRSPTSHSAIVHLKIKSLTSDYAVAQLKGKTTHNGSPTQMSLTNSGSLTNWGSPTYNVCVIKP